MANKKRLIDPDELLEEIERVYSYHYEMSYEQAIHDFFNAVRRRIRRYSTVDAVEVVRCKDCKHWQESVDGITKWCPLLMSKETKADDFCSYGERRTDERKAD